MDKKFSSVSATGCPGRDFGEGLGGLISSVQFAYLGTHGQLPLPRIFNTVGLHLLLKPRITQFDQLAQVQQIMRHPC